MLPTWLAALSLDKRKHFSNWLTNERMEYFGQFFKMHFQEESIPSDIIFTARRQRGFKIFHTLALLFKLFI